jgi:hypothetical protein
VVLVEMGDPATTNKVSIWYVAIHSHVGHHEALIHALDVGLDSHWPVELVELASRTWFGGVILPPTGKGNEIGHGLACVIVVLFTVFLIAIGQSNWRVELDYTEVVLVVELVEDDPLP